MPNVAAPLTFSAHFDPSAIPAAGPLPLTDADFNGSTGSLLLIVNDAFGTESLFCKSGNLEGVLFGVDLGTFARGIYAADVFINMSNLFGRDFTKNVPGEIAITPVPGAAILFGTALAGIAGVRRWRRA